MATVHAFNPESQPPVKLTAAAVKHFQNMVQAHPNQFIVLDVKTTGCSGYSYFTHLEASVSADTMAVADTHGLPLYITQQALPLLQGITIDYQTQSLGQKGLRYINPNETGRCGCGESFTTDPKFKDKDSLNA